MKLAVLGPRPLGQQDSDDYAGLVYLVEQRQEQRGKEKKSRPEA